MRRLLATAIAGIVLLVAAPDARAGDFAFTVGRDLGAIDIAGVQGVTNVGSRIGYRLDRFHLFGTVDYGRFSTKTDFKSPDLSAVGSRGSILTVGAGTRYLFQPPEADRAIPYVVANGFTVLPTFDKETGPPGPRPIEESSSWGFLAGFGVDYYFSPAFSVGGEAGATGIFASQTDAISTWRGSLLQIYTGVELNFFL